MSIDLDELGWHSIVSQDLEHQDHREAMLALHLEIDDNSASPRSSSEAS